MPRRPKGFRVEYKNKTRITTISSLVSLHEYLNSDLWLENASLCIVSRTWNRKKKINLDNEDQFLQSSYLSLLSPR